MKKIFLLLLVMILILPMALSCGGKKNEGKPTSEPSSADESGNVTDEDDGFHLPDINYGNRDFNILSLTDYNDRHYLVYHDETGDPLSSEAFSRTLYIEKTYGVVLKFTGVPDAVTTLYNSHIGGGGDYDLIDPHPTEGIVQLLTSGILADLYSLSYLSLDKAWYNQSQAEGYTIDGKLFIVASDLTLTGQNFTGLVFNKEIYRSLEQEDDLYDLVDNHGWTMERLLQLSALYGQDEDSNNIYDANDTYGIVYHKGYTTSFMYGMGQTILKKEEDGLYHLAFDTNRLTTMAETLYGLLYESDNHAYIGTANVASYPGSDMWKIFSSGRALFATFDFGGLYVLLRDLDFEKGYLPLPMLDPDQTDYQVFCGAGFLGIPALAKDTSASAVLLEALSYYSFKNLRTVFFNAILQGRLAKKPEDYKMLELMHEKKIYDVGFTLDQVGVAAQMLQTVVVDNKRTAIATYLRSKGSEIKQLEKLANELKADGGNGES